MKKILIILVLCFGIQSGVMAREVRFMDRVKHPVATIIHSFAWLQDPFHLIYCLNGGISGNPRDIDMVRYADYVTGETDSY